ncbi:Adenylosuccinate lyase [Neonectria ditissima]|uniref:Adenylosuccinate lyase n=1 Tax=Neonectria ditissima TaxID=78410 RepID=A0A0P7BH90_9HYPO|nr:Adenylosuccinate lyase [Neonectria ditissima]
MHPRRCSPSFQPERGLPLGGNQLWLWLAEAEHELGIKEVTDEALEQMRANLTMTDEDFEVARVEEARRRHDVMAHVHAFGQVAPAAAGVIHYGATSCFVTDNADLIFDMPIRPWLTLEKIRDGLDILLPKLAKVIQNLSAFALQYKDLPTLGFTHFQAAQPITVGKRAAQWIQELIMDLEDFEHVRDQLRFRGAVGTTGTQASFMEIFGSDGDKLDELNKKLCEKAGFPGIYPVSTQTYTRKVDLRIANVLSAFGATAQRIAIDIRHLAHMKEIEEPMEKDQRNPMRSERITSLGRELMNKNANFAQTFAGQWFERTLDDSAISLNPQPYLPCASLDNVTNGLVVYPEMIRAHLDAEIPFMASENIIMKLVSKGGNRQEAHEQIRVLSRQAGLTVKNEGKPNDLIERIRNTEYFSPIHGDLDAVLDPSLYIGRSAVITERMCAVAKEKLARYSDYLAKAQTAQLSL